MTTSAPTLHIPASNANTSTQAARSLLLQLAAGAALGLVLLYGVAFADSPSVHNAAHDVRHVTVKPCH